MKQITFVWIVFSILFLSLAICHLFAAQQEMPHFEAKPTRGVAQIGRLPVAKSGFKKFIPEMNSFIDEQNESTSNQNYLSAFGYGLAFITAILSAFLTVDKYSEKLNSSYFNLRRK